MSVVRNIKINFYKILTGYGFYVCIVFTFILCVSSTVYYDSAKAEEYSFMQAVFQFDKEFMLSESGLSAYSVMEKGAGTWLSMFIPIVAAFSFVPIVCDEFEAKSVRFMVFRTKKISYYISKFLTACICGGLAVMIGFILFLIVDFACFPGIQEYNAEIQEMLLEEMLVRYPVYEEGEAAAVITERLVYVFLYGVLYTAPATVLTSIIRNKYIVLCIPFFLKYGISTLAYKLSERLESMSQIQIYSTLHPDAMLSLYGEWETKKYAIYYTMGLVIISCCLYIFLNGRRLDSGE